LKVVFDDNPAEEPEMGTWQFPSDWGQYTALEFDVYNEGPYYTELEVGLADSGGGWYPQTGGIITLLPNSQAHVVLSLAEVGREVNLGQVEWLSLAPGTITEEQDYRGELHTWRLGHRTLYADNVRLVRVVRWKAWLPVVQRSAVSRSRGLFHRRHEPD